MDNFDDFKLIHYLYRNRQILNLIYLNIKLSMMSNASLS